MIQRTNLKIMAFVGLAGSGKSTAVEYFTNKDYPKVYFGGVILQAMEAAGIDRTPEREQKFREKFREENGKDFVANKIVEQIQNLANAGQRRIIADGIYTWTEYQVIKKAFPGELKLVAIVAPRQTRYHRLADRAIRPFTATQAYNRDISEIENLEKGGPIAIADHYVINDGNMEDLHKKLANIAEEIKF